MKTKNLFMIIYLIGIYFWVNAYLTGKLINECETHKYWIIQCLGFMFLMLFAIPFYAIVFIAERFVRAFKFINELTQIKFYFDFYVRGKWHLSPYNDLLRQINYNASIRKKDTRRNRNYKRGVALINKRNNYTPK